MDDSKPESVRVLVKGTKHRTKILVAGAAVSFVGWTVWGLGVPPHVWLFIGGVVTTVLIAMFLAFHDVRVERDRFEEQLRPRFEVIDDDPACYQTAETAERGRYELRRAVIRNAGGETIDEIRVSVVRIRRADGERLHIPIGLPLPLIPQHNKGIKPDGAFTLNPGETRPVDVAIVSEKLHPADLEIRQSVPDHVATIPHWEGKAVLFDLLVVGKDVSSVTRTARVFRDTEGLLALTLVSR